MTPIEMDAFEAIRRSLPQIVKQLEIMNELKRIEIGIDDDEFKEICKSS